MLVLLPSLVPATHVPEAHLLPFEHSAPGPPQMPSDAPLNLGWQLYTCAHVSLDRDKV